MSAPRGLAGRSLGAARAQAQQQRLIQQPPSQLPLAQLLPSPENAREQLRNIEDLAETIKTDGLTQALTVVPAAVYLAEYPQHTDAVTTAGRPYVVIHGHRRLAAAQLAALDVVPVLIRDKVENIRVAALLENEAREPLTPIEQGREYKAIMEELGLSQRALGQRIKVSQTKVSHRVALLDLIPELQQKVLDEHLQKGTGITVSFAARVLARLRPDLQQAYAAGQLTDAQATTTADVDQAAQQLPEAASSTRDQATPAPGQEVIATQSPAIPAPVDSGSSQNVPTQRHNPTPPAPASTQAAPASSLATTPPPGPAATTTPAPQPATASSTTTTVAARAYIPITTPEDIAQALVDALTEEELEAVRLLLS